MPEYLQSSQLPIELSFDGGITWKQLVCVTNYTAPLSMGNTETETLNCGTLQGVGSPKFDFTGEAVTDLTPAATHVSQADLEAVMLASTTIWARVTYPASGSTGAKIFRKGQVLVTQSDIKASPSDLIKFDFTLKGQGTPDIVAP